LIKTSRKRLEVHRTLISIAVCTLQQRGKVLVKHGLLEKCLRKGLRRSQLFPVDREASSAKFSQDPGF
jgi:hypothetical protein